MWTGGGDYLSTRRKNISSRAGETLYFGKTRFPSIRNAYFEDRPIQQKLESQKNTSNNSRKIDMFFGLVELKWWDEVPKQMQNVKVIKFLKRNPSLWPENRENSMLFHTFSSMMCEGNCLHIRNRIARSPICFRRRKLPAPVPIRSERRPYWDASGALPIQMDFKEETVSPPYHRRTSLAEREIIKCTLPYIYIYIYIYIYTVYIYIIYIYDDVHLNISLSAREILRW